MRSTEMHSMDTASRCPLSAISLLSSRAESADVMRDRVDKRLGRFAKCSCRRRPDATQYGGSADGDAIVIW